MTTWSTIAEMSYGREVWEARLQEAEQSRKVHRLPRRKPPFLLVWIVDKVVGEGPSKRGVLQEAKA